MASQYSMRYGSVDDIHNLLELERKTYPHHPWNEKHFQDELQHEYSRTILYTDDETDEKIAGYIVFRVLPDCVHILNVVVSLEWRGLGMGQKLIHQAINEAYRMKREKVVLELRENNKAALELYKKIGFKQLGLTKKYYSNGDSAIHMVLTVAPDIVSGSSSENSSDAAPKLEQ